MKRLFILVFLLPFCLSAQNLKDKINTDIRGKIYDPSKAANMYQAIVDLSKRVVASGTNTYTASTHAYITSYQSGDVYIVTFTNGNTGASTLNINSLGAKTIQKNGAALASGDIPNGSTLQLSYDGTNFQIVGAASGGGGGGTVTSVSVTSANGFSGSVATATTTPAITLSLQNATTSQSGQLTAADWNTFDGKADKHIPTNRQTSDYTLVLSDDGKTVEMNSTVATNLTVPNNSTVAFPIGTQISIAQYGSAPANVVAAGGVTLRSQSGALATPGQFSVIVLYKIGTNEWYCWDGSPSSILSPSFGGTGINNGSKTITLGGNLITSGAFNTTLAVSGSNTITFPNANITVARTDAAQTFTGVQTFTAAPVFSSSFALPNGTTATTQSPSDNSTKIATTAYVDAAAGGSGTSWALASGGTLTGANTITGSISNTIKLLFNKTTGAPGAVLTDGEGIHLQNTTAATAGNQQFSPMITLEGQGWKTSATAGSQTVKWGLYANAVQGTTNPATQFVLASSVNGAAYSSVLTVQNNGSIAGTGSMSMTNYTASVANPYAATFVNYLPGLSYTTYSNTGTSSPTGAGTATIESFKESKTIGSSTATINWSSFVNALSVSALGINNLTGFIHNPTLTGAVSGNHYGFISVPVAARNGFGTASPNSSLQVNGSFSVAYSAKTAGYTLTDTDHVIEVTSGTHTQTLPSAVGITGRKYTITNSGTGVVTVATTSSQTFVNVTATPTTLTLNQFQCVTVVSNGSNWLRIATL